MWHEVVQIALGVAAAMNAAALFGALFSSKLRRRWTPAAATEAARWNAFRRYLRDFPRLQEAPPASVALWERLLVYGIAFGLADRVMQAAKIAAPTELASRASSTRRATTPAARASTRARAWRASPPTSAPPSRRRRAARAGAAAGSPAAVAEGAAAGAAAPGDVGGAGGAARISFPAMRTGFLAVVVSLLVVPGAVAAPTPTPYEGTANGRFFHIIPPGQAGTANGLQTAQFLTAGERRRTTPTSATSTRTCSTRRPG